MSYGILKYDPRHSKTRQEDWWLVAECSRGLVLTYKWLLEREGIKSVKASKFFQGDYNWQVTQKGIKVAESAWNAHISVVRGETPLNQNAWKKYQGERIEFEYSPILQSNGAHWWLPVVSKDLDDIRSELGLPKVSSSYISEYFNDQGLVMRCPAQFHLTIGKDIDSPPKRKQ